MRRAQTFSDSCKCVQLNRSTDRLKHWNGKKERRDGLSSEAKIVGYQILVCKQKRLGGALSMHSKPSWIVVADVDSTID